LDHAAYYQLVHDYWLQLDSLDKGEDGEDGNEVRWDDDDDDLAQRRHLHDQ